MNTTNKRQFLFAALALASFFIMPSAQAVSLYTSPVWADHGSSYHACNVTNIGIKPLSVKTEMFDSSNNVLITRTDTLAAGQSTEVTDPLTTGAFARCRFTAIANKIRANITVFHYNTDHYETLALDPAR
jgi:hypothetical protein